MAKKMTFKDMAKTKRGGPVRRLGKGETATIRFLFSMEDEDDGWRYLISHFDEELRRSVFFDDADDVPSGAKIREAYFAVAYDVDKATVDVWEFRKSLTAELAEYDDEYGNITDRAYRIKRRGDGLKTKYTATPLDKTPMTKAMLKGKSKARGLMQARLDLLVAE